MRIFGISRLMRRQRINHLVEQIGEHEAAMRGLCAALIELTDEGDDLHMEIRLLLEALDR